MNKKTKSVATAALPPRSEMECDDEYNDEYDDDYDTNDDDEDYDDEEDGMDAASADFFAQYFMGIGGNQAAREIFKPCCLEACILLRGPLQSFCW